MTRKKSFRPPETVSVSVHRNGAELRTDVRWPDVQLVLQSFLEVFRSATKQYPELIVDLPHVGGSSVQYVDDWSDGEARKKRIGF
jgi:hypothetical protein